MSSLQYLKITDREIAILAIGLILLVNDSD